MPVNGDVEAVFSGENATMQEVEGVVIAPPNYSEEPFFVSVKNGMIKSDSDFGNLLESKGRDHPS